MVIHGKVSPRKNLINRKLMGRNMDSYFRKGNAGDILTGDIIEWKYNKAYKNIKK